jgi:hypothetical protein
MERYDVVTHDDEKVVGHVVDKAGRYYIVEQGALFKSKHPLPEEFAWLDEENGRLVMSVSGEMLHGSPKVNGDVDEQAVAAYYGLADTTVDTPADYDDSEAVQKRLDTLEGVEATDGIHESPALLGDRFDDTHVERGKR